MIFDSHMHSKFSTDSTMNILDAIKVGKENNIGIIITDHMDLDYPIKDEFRFDIPSYFNEYGKYRSDTIKLGIEIGLTENTLIDNEAIAKNYDFDFILGSIHSVKGLDIYEEYVHQGYNKKEFFSYYFEDMLKCVQSYNSYDSLSHIDYPCRYCSFDNKEILISEYKDILAEIFNTLINKGKVLELNTSRLHIPEANKALKDMYRLYTSLGAKYVTIGSDAHTHLNIHRNFDLALEFIEDLGLKGVYFNKRKMEFF
ncbi:histidinol phosphate phosphatase [Clostridium sp. AL.422]|uniref:histidinol phosphate phosphatase n=1 Tax=Clostridium TaxID=1485 RepID=UPI00293DDCBE|nr:MULTISPECIES: histidinol phosphate phosphatase [unclassified Clostridium]MDV4150912.1 histidinol phosphate phosphatase [Clostridium sp. AL.422]